ncbi:MAG TPA: helix-turn-helix domain-containing protein [Gaiellaceae bacterium]|nr:helix-turn-helix domain-containing protein [Gaiellaceae bacterium]
MNGESAETSLHRALADERRSRIVAELRAEPAGIDVQELSRRLGLHPNTLRWHLGILGDAGVVVSHPAPRSTPGRPRIVYTLRGEIAARGHDEYRLLAAILAGTVADDADAERRSEQAGRAWGRFLVHRPQPGVRLSEEAAMGEVVRLLGEQGFQPELDGRELRMHRCPFHDLAEQYPEVVCAAHRGLLAGALDELGGGLELAAVDVFAEPSLCVARLAPAAAGSGRAGGRRAQRSL